MVIGVDDALILAAAATAASGAAGYFGSQETNRANMAMNRGQMEYQWGVDQWSAAKQIDAMREQYGLNRTSQERAIEAESTGAREQRDWANWQGEIARQFNSQEAALARDFSASQALMARDWMQGMSNTAYQRAMSDMRAAGLNPILAYSQGGASTPTSGAPIGAQASTSPPSGAAAGGASGGVSGGVSAAHGAPGFARMENVLGPAVSSAVQGANAVMGVQQAAAQIDQTRAQTALTSAAEAQARSQTALNSAQTITEAERSGLVSAQRASELTVPSLRAAQTSAHSAQAGLAREQRITEQERPGLVREQAREAGAGANRAQVQADQQRTYGPPGTVSSTVGGISQTVDSIWRSLRESLQ